MKKILSRCLIGLTATCALALTISTLSLAWFKAPGGTTDKETIDGEVGLRSYFYTGDGSENRPFEIVSPVHFYNLTRLQNLGVFPQKRYFRMGHVFEGDSFPSCINRYNNDGTPVKEAFLDMGTFSANTRVLPIGGEGAPFVGEFNGYGIPIRNLKVQGNPEDIGVFGYVSFEGKVDGLVCENLEIHSLGYSNTPPDSSTELFGQDIDDIFTNAAEKYLAKDTSLDFYDNEDLGNELKHLKHLNGLAPTTINGINHVDKRISSTSTVYNGYFLPTFPSSGNVDFKYSWKSSSSLLRKCTVEDKQNGLQIADADISKAVVVDMEALSVSSESIEDKGFNCGKDMQVDARLSLIASVQIGGFTYSRVIQSYKVEFYSKSTTWSEGGYGMTIFCDYIDTGSTTDKPTNYHHGNNIGFLAGHVDGSVTNSYVYKGKMYMNDSASCHEIETESETGLIGEVGTNVVNSLDPDFGLTSHGDTGVINFTKIYGKIREDFDPGDTIYVGHDPISGRYYASYQNHRNMDSFNLFSDYLRHMDNSTHDYITRVDSNKGGIDHLEEGDDTLWHQYTLPANSSVPLDFQSVDFLWNRVIQDEENADRGLGVFKIVSSYNSGAINGAYGNYMYANMGECYIRPTSPKTKVYFSTAEYDHTIPDQPAWGTENGQIDPLRPTNLPSYSDERSFEYPFSRDYNYCFELDLAQIGTTGGKNYMYNTDSEYLTNYLKYQLIDKFGGPITPGNPRFGFMFRSSENEQLNALTYYMPLQKPGNKRNYGTSQEPVYYPSNSIVFEIANENGANVSVIGNGANISIYSYNPESSSQDVTKVRTMMSSNRNDSNVNVDYHRYFTYNAATGETGTECETISANNMADGDALYAHIFKLPKGHYVLGASDTNTTAKVYFLAVQGQTDASLGDNDQASVGNAVTDVDFLLAAPTLANYPSSLSRAEFNFRSNFDTSLNRLFEVTTKEVSGVNYLSFEFVDNPQFVTYLLLNSRGNSHVYYLNDTRVDRAQYVVPRV